MFLSLLNWVGAPFLHAAVIRHEIKDENSDWIARLHTQNDADLNSLSLQAYLMRLPCRITYAEDETEFGAACVNFKKLTVETGVRRDLLETLSSIPAVQHGNTLLRWSICSARLQPRRGKKGRWMAQQFIIPETHRGNLHSESRSRFSLSERSLLQSNQRTAPVLKSSSSSSSSSFLSYSHSIWGEAQPAGQSGRRSPFCALTAGGWS